MGLPPTKHLKRASYQRREHIRPLRRLMTGHGCFHGIILRMCLGASSKQAIPHAAVRKGHLLAACEAGKEICLNACVLKRQGFAEGIGTSKHTSRTRGREHEEHCSFASLGCHGWHTYVADGRRRNIPISPRTKRAGLVRRADPLPKPELPTSCDRSFLVSRWPA